MRLFMTMNGTLIKHPSHSNNMVQRRGERKDERILSNCNSTISIDIKPIKLNDIIECKR